MDSQKGPQLEKRIYVMKEGSKINLDNIFMLREAPWTNLYTWFEKKFFDPKIFLSPY
jgi:hypothetical protein